MTDVPTWDQFMAPALRALLDGEVHRSREICEAAADLLSVTSEARNEQIPSGQQRYVNRANWALSYLNRAGATDRPSRGRYRITEIGRQLLTDHPNAITEKDLQAVAGDSLAAPSWKAFDSMTAESAAGTSTALDPVEQVEDGIARLQARGCCGPPHSSPLPGASVL